jgi:lincosamide nucleotidyltransferase
MSLIKTRISFLSRLIAAAERDPRIVGLVDYGSSSEGRADAWSDVDVALFIRDAELASFEAQWKLWASQFGTLLLAYVGGVGHPWVVYDAEPMPLRVDFAFHAESTIEQMLSWPNAPTSITSMVLYDTTGGRIGACAARLVGQSLQPPDLGRAFEMACGDFWYYLLRLDAKLRRGQLWAARYEFNAIVIGNLLALLRFEAGATDRWRAAAAATAIEQVLIAERHIQLDACIPGADQKGLLEGIRQTARLGRIVCTAVAEQHGWPWPEALAGRIEALLNVSHESIE